MSEIEKGSISVNQNWHLHERLHVSTLSLIDPDIALHRATRSTQISSSSKLRSKHKESCWADRAATDDLLLQILTTRGSATYLTIPSCWRTRRRANHGGRTTCKFVVSQKSHLGLTDNHRNYVISVEQPQTQS